MSQKFEFVGNEFFLVQRKWAVSWINLQNYAKKKNIFIQQNNMHSIQIEGHAFRIYNIWMFIKGMPISKVKVQNVNACLACE